MGPDQRPVKSGVRAEGSQIPRVIKRASEATAQTPGMNRRVAVPPGEVSEALWFGAVTCPAGLNSGPHHHAEAETAGYMLSGDHIRVYYGEDYREFIEVHPGDFLYVPAWIPHIEVNMSAKTPAEFITARRPDNIVVNIDGDEGVPAELRR